MDIVVRISEPDLFILAGIKNDLEGRLNKSIDIDAETVFFTCKRKIPDLLVEI